VNTLRKGDDGIIIIIIIYIIWIADVQSNESFAGHQLEGLEQRKQRDKKKS
jgi:hypothetical protein